VGIGIQELRMHDGDLQACEGDSGGPLFAETEAGRRLVAVVSRGAGESNKCDSGSLVTRVDTFEDWIWRAAEDLDPPQEFACSTQRTPGSGALLLLAAVLLGLRRRRS
jgi:MYXO-CTERM domain-containing protein